MKQEKFCCDNKSLDNRVYTAVIFHIFRGTHSLRLFAFMLLVKFTNLHDNSSCSTSRWLANGEGSRNLDGKDEQISMRVTFEVDL